MSLGVCFCRKKRAVSKDVTIFLNIPRIGNPTTVPALPRKGKLGVWQKRVGVQAVERDKGNR